jgi:hypothetical protein
MTNIYGIMPIKPWKEFDIILGNILVTSFIALGANNMKTPILHISKSSKNGTNLKKIEGILEIYF